MKPEIYNMLTPQERREYNKIKTRGQRMVFTKRWMKEHLPQNSKPEKEKFIVEKLHMPKVNTQYIHRLFPEKNIYIDLRNYRVLIS